MMEILPLRSMIANFDLLDCFDARPRARGLHDVVFLDPRLGGRRDGGTQLAVREQPTQREQNDENPHVPADALFGARCGAEERCLVDR